MFFFFLKMSKTGRNHVNRNMFGTTVVEQHVLLSVSGERK